MGNPKPRGTPMATQMPSDRPSRVRRSIDQRRAQIFDVPAALCALPLVRQIVGDIVEQTARSAELESRNAELAPQRDDSTVHRERRNLLHEIGSAKERIAELRQELDNLGVRLLRASSGWVGFRTLVNGSLAYLVYRHGDEKLRAWRFRDDRRLRRIPECWEGGFDAQPEEQEQGLETS